MTKLQTTVIGSGRMGAPIARRLANAGHDVYVVDTNRQRRKEAVAAGLQASADVWDVPRDTVLTVLPDAATFRAAADHVRDALTFFVGGPLHDVERARPILMLLARPGGIRHVGEDIRLAYVLKLLINALWFGQVAAVTEALMTARAHGISEETFSAMVGGSVARSAFTDDYLPRLLQGDYIADFGLRECVEELDLASALAHAASVRHPVLDAVAMLHNEALDAFGPIDGEMLVARYLEQSADAAL